MLTDAGVKHLARIKNLRKLDLSNTLVTDVGLKYLAGLKNFQLLVLARIDNVTDAGVAELPKALPKLKIEKKTKKIESGG